MTGQGVELPIDPDLPATWPDATRRWAETQASRLAYTTEFVGDLAISLEQEDTFRQTFGRRKLIGYHSTRLLAHESDSIIRGGLRLLDEQLVRQRIANADTHGGLSDDALREAEARNVYTTGHARNRADRVCLVLGRSVFDEGASGCDGLLRYWGGEAIRGGPQDVAELAVIGVPSIVVAQLDLTRPHNNPYVWPPLAKLFVATLLEFDGRFAEVHYPAPVPGGDILAIWHPGDTNYDRHTRLPR